MPRIDLSGVEALILDWDGTVTDSQETNYQALAAALRRHEVAVDRDWYRNHAGLSIHELLAAIPGAAQAVPAEEIVAACRARLLQDVQLLRPVPATMALLNDVRVRGLPVGVASGASTALVHAGVRVLALDGMFAAVVTTRGCGTRETGTRPLPRGGAPTRSAPRGLPRRR